MEGVLDNNAHKTYLTRDVFMRERIESFTISIRGACQALSDHCDVPAEVIMELVVENLLNTEGRPD